MSGEDLLGGGLISGIEVILVGEGILGGGIFFGSEDVLDGGVISGGGDILVAKSYWVMESNMVATIILVAEKYRVVKSF